MNPLLEARRLSVEIGGRRVVSDLDLVVTAGESLAILGRNGAGKSTLLTTLSGLRPAAAGEVLLGGESCRRLAPRCAARRRAWLSQSQGDPFGSTVLETALSGRHPHLGRWEWESAADAVLARAALAAVGLGGLEGRSVATLSGGERQWLAIATLLTQDPPLYLLDEPLSHLDLSHQVSLLELFASRVRARGIGVVMVLHDPGLAHRFCQRALLLHDNGHWELGPVAETLNSAKLSALYQHPLTRVDTASGPAFIPG